MSEKRKIFDRLMGMFDRLESVNKAHTACISNFQKVVNEVMESDFYEYQRPEHYADCLSDKDIPPIDPLTANLPPELASVILLLQAELKNQQKSIAATQRMMEIYADHLHIALQNCGNCTSCHNLFAKNLLRPVEDKGVLKFICNDCFEDEYFDCHKCKRVLPNSEQGEEDSELRYGWICKDCIKPMRFPQEVVIAPDFPGCAEIAGATLAALCKYAHQATGSMEPEYSDTITLKFVKKLSEYDALYESQKGAKYEIGELDYRGVGSMRELKEESDA